MTEMEKTIWEARLDRNPENLFRGWFNNHMTILLFMVQQPKPRKARTMLRIEFFIEDVEHHYIGCHGGKSVHDAFRYLKRYCKVYPAVTYRHSERAVEMVGRIYEALGLKLTTIHSLAPTEPHQERIKKEIKDSIKQIFRPALTCAVH